MEWRFKRSRRTALDLAPGAWSIVKDMDETTLLTAGRFAVLTGLSAKALRLYAENGLLSPLDVDPVTGYRRYGTGQVARARLIGLLRAAGLGLRDVAAVTRADDAEALRLIDAYETSLARQAVAGALVLAQARTHYRKDTTMIDPTPSVVLDQPVLSLLRRLHVGEIDSVIATSVAALRKSAAELGLQVTGDPFGIFHAPVDDENDGPLEICLPTDDLAPSRGPDGTDDAHEIPSDLRSLRLAGGRFVGRRVTGAETDFPAILATYDALHSWIDEQGHTPVGPPRETWHTTPGGDEPLSLTVSWPYA